MNRSYRISLSSALLAAFLWAFATFAQSAEPRYIGLLLDEPAVAPPRVESDILAEITRGIVADFNKANADGLFALRLLATSDGGIVDRMGARPDMNNFESLLVYQGDVIAQNTALFNEKVVGDLTEYLNSDPRHSVVLLGGAAALFEKLGFGANLKTTALTFGEDRAQNGIIPTNSGSKIFDGVDLDRGIAWITNAAFPAFNTFSMEGDDVSTLAEAPAEGHLNPFLVGLREVDGQPVAKAFVFAWRVNPIYDSAPETYKANFERLLTNMIEQVGKPIDPNDCVKPRYIAPDFDAIQRALEGYEDDVDETSVPRLEDHFARLANLRERSQALEDAIANGEEDGVDEKIAAIQTDYDSLQSDVMFSYPDLDFVSFLYVRRNPKQLGLPENYNSNSVLPKTGYDDELRRYDFRAGENKLVYKPEKGEFVGDLELYYDASKVMFSSPDLNSNRWRLWELALDENGDAAQDKPELAPLINDPDVDNYDGCYLPDDRVIFCSTASMTGVPCINGSGHVCNLYIKELDGSIRQLTIEQDHDWNPVVMNNGRVMYLRWEYVDLPHCFSRIMFHMNPDGTNQAELYGSGSYWPNSCFAARPLPGDSSKFVGVVTGHHELNRMGDMVIFDPAQGRKETSGAVQRIPGYGKKVEPIACDLPIAQNWPKFLHPFPISDRLFIVSCKRSAQTPWEICLADIYDNIVPILTDPDAALLEPIPLRETERQPIIADRVDLDSPTADVFIADVYEGEGLKGVPRGEVKALRVFSYQFAYQGMGAEPYSVGLDGPWDPRRIIGTVPVLEDGSAAFKIPAYVPIALQPLDKDGNALQIMRSWITAQPGESVSCIGCHEPQNSTGTTNPRSLASQIDPVEITPFYGETRGFGFEREIQPILNRYCVECHQPDSAKVAELIKNGDVSEDVLKATKREHETFEDTLLPDFRKSDPKCVLDNGNYIATKSPISNSYYQLRRYVRTVTKESQMPTHPAYDFHADASLLVQLLQRGHFGVELDPESWDKIVTWIDLNCPYNGSWGEMIRDNPALVKSQYSRREELRKLYAPSSEQLDDDPNDPAIVNPEPNSPLRLRFSSEVKEEQPVKFAKPRGDTVSVPLSNDVRMDFVKMPNSKISVGKFEVTNEQYKIFDPTYDTGIEYGDFIQFSPGERGWLLSRAKQPVARVSYKDAEAFCAWLSEKTGDEYRLPTYAEWRAFADEASLQGDYGARENLADSTHAYISPFGWTGRVETLPAWRPVDWAVNDHSRVSAPVGSYKKNAYGLYDVLGNVAEWTSGERVDKREVVDVETGEKVSESVSAKRIAAGGSWTTPARFATPETVRAFPESFKTRDVGFRVVRVEK
ncbi:MAG: SUMF1/EgtB/PvdO family nonheme iron enzyme [Thermoguttaceae bacterium]|nr:SUMF1/EgtB/PvdO family nonheme iron enzyme [Thermoguttaceae bacterium]